MIETGTALISRIIINDLFLRIWDKWTWGYLLPCKKRFKCLQPGLVHAVVFFAVTLILYTQFFYSCWSVSKIVAAPWPIQIIHVLEQRALSWTSWSLPHGLPNSAQRGHSVLFVHCLLFLSNSSKGLTKPYILSPRHTLLNICDNSYICHVFFSQLSTKHVLL